MRLKVYIETTIISYLTAKPSRRLLPAARQAATKQWWSKYAQECDLFVSELVTSEAQEGDDEASRRRMKAIVGLPMLPVTDEVSRLARRLVTAHALPTKAEDDALHVALARVHEMDVLLRQRQ